MGVEWVARLPDAISNRIKSEFSKDIKKKYKIANDNFSTVGVNNTTAVFPFIYVEELPCNPGSKDLERVTINGLQDYTMQIHVTDNKSQSNAKIIAYEILRIMVKMHFDCIVQIESTEDKTYGYVLRCSRNIDEGDIL